MNDFNKHKDYLANEEGCLCLYLAGFLATIFFINAVLFALGVPW